MKRLLDERIANLNFAWIVPVFEKVAAFARDGLKRPAPFVASEAARIMNPRARVIKLNQLVHERRSELAGYASIGLKAHSLRSKCSDSACSGTHGFRMAALKTIENISMPNIEARGARQWREIDQKAQFEVLGDGLGLDDRSKVGRRIWI